jgi:hypothetical protein
MMKATRAIALATALLLAGCSFVKLTDAGAGVSQATAADVANCDRVGIVSTTTRDRVGIKRGSAKVQEELTVLGRNEAAGLGADTIVPIEERDGGTQSFTAYRCGSD